jgi:hypothetical protein
MPPKSSKLRNILEKLEVIKDKNENSTLLNLTKIPPKEPRKHTPHTHVGKANVANQCDILYLPNDGGYKYLLVVVDIGTKKCDVEPLKVRDAGTVKTALKAIYARKIIKQPLRLEVDGGTEFRGEFQKHFSKILNIITKVANRSRQQSVVESKNGQIGEVLNTAMLADEMANDATSKKWVYLLKPMVKLLNKEYAVEPKMTDIEAPVITNKFTEDILDIGTKVRVQLDKPVNYVDGKPEVGKFRKGDIRWSKDVKTITRFFLRPNQVPLYQVDDDARVAYSRFQLQLVADNEVMPISRDGAEAYAQKITDKKTIKSKVYYTVLWEDGSTSQEPRSQLIKDGLDNMIKEYEQSVKKK